MQDHQQLFQDQINSWPLATQNYHELSHVLTKEFIFNDFRIKLQYNPNRIISSSADIDKNAIKKRECFLCRKNRPVMQKSDSFDSGFEILVNPYPVFPMHFTIASTSHQPQRIQGQFQTLLDLAQKLNDCVVFYNGPRCGASAPDHLHFQAGNKGLLPIECDFSDWNKFHLSPLIINKNFQIRKFENFLRNGWIIEGTNASELIRNFDIIYNVLVSAFNEQNEEPMLNIVCWFEKEKWIYFIFPRKAHRPNCYFRKDETKLLISPASVEMGGLFIVARLEDFNKIDKKDIVEIYDDVSVLNDEIEKLSELVKAKLQEKGNS